jgi:hypothetical protein
VEALVDLTKRDQLAAAARAAKNIPANVRSFLLCAAERHAVFDYQAIAEYYAHAAPEVQRLMEESALVIIDFDKAVRGGFVELAEEIRQAMADDYDAAA